MDSFDIRRENLMELAKQYKRQNIFCEMIEMNPSYMSQIKSRRKNVGDQIARMVEKKLGLPHGYMDLPQNEVASVNPTAEPTPDSLSLEGLSDLQRGCLRRLEALMRSSKVSDDECLDLMVNWKAKHA